mmetsp:Transcript_85094/g.268409  ORF Transcript_85094/g.268409 Transcript_85094/m.268409 type:complete len:200 (+) Transcript_85094:106-705(+)
MDPPGRPYSSTLPQGRWQGRLGAVVLHCPGAAAAKLGGCVRGQCSRAPLRRHGAFPLTSSRLLPSRRVLALGPVRAGGGAAPAVLVLDARRAVLEVGLEVVGKLLEEALDVDELLLPLVGLLLAEVDHALALVDTHPVQEGEEEHGLVLQRGVAVRGVLGAALVPVGECHQLAALGVQLGLHLLLPLCLDHGLVPSQQD